MRRTLSSVIFAGALLALAVLAFTAAPWSGRSPVSGEGPNAPTAGPKYNTLALPLDGGITLASELAADIDSTTGTTTQQVLEWNVGSGTFTTFEPGNPFSTDFSLNTGDPVFILSAGGSPDVYSIVGGVPPVGSVSFNLIGSAGSCTYNFISVPLDKTNLTDAASLATDIGNVTQVLEWNSNTETYSTYEPGNPFSNNFGVKVGYPYFVCMTASKTWPS